MFKASARLLATLLALSATNSLASELCTLIVDAASGATILNTGTDCTTRVTPASTFKVAISLMAFDSGVVKDGHRPAWRYVAGYPDWAGDAWKGDIDPTDWMKRSVFWYSQQIAKKLGQAQFENYVTSFKYGNQDVSAVEVQQRGNNGVWVMSSLQISPLEQVAFLRSMVNRQLPVSAHSYQMTEEITQQDDVNGWKVYGKTGTGSPGQDNKYRADQAYGWYVGWARKGTKALVFARLIQDETARAPNAGLRAQSQLSEQLLLITYMR
ncbi:class D beta-lactamase [Pigmentiphaga litoralis]|uniref:class D beta-lactamase OXA-1383 n=1 Tax=Pigmentiphaga litoralis TaxID=516702 RepID=UPI00389A6C0A